MSDDDKFAEVESLIGELPKLVERDPICCIYFLVRSGEVVYVGQTSDLVTRIRSHRSEGTKQFDFARYLVMDEETLNNAEKYFFELFEPVYNGNTWAPYSRQRNA